MGYYDDHDDDDIIEEWIEEDIPCPKCRGRGEVKITYAAISGRPPDIVTCTRCEGSGGFTRRRRIR